MITRSNRRDKQVEKKEEVERGIKWKMNKGKAMKMIVDDRVDNDPSNYKRRQTMSGMIMLEREREKFREPMVERIK